MLQKQIRNRSNKWSLCFRASSQNCSREVPPYIWTLDVTFCLCYVMQKVERCQLCCFVWHVAVPVQYTHCISQYWCHFCQNNSCLLIESEVYIWLIIHTQHVTYLICAFFVINNPKILCKTRLLLSCDSLVIFGEQITNGSITGNKWVTVEMWIYD